MNLIIEHERKLSRRPAERAALIAAITVGKDLVQLIGLMRKAAMDPRDEFPTNFAGILSTQTFEVIQKLDLDKDGPTARMAQGTIMSITWREHIPATIVHMADAVQGIIHTHGNFLDPELIADLYNLSQTTLFKLTPVLANMGSLNTFVERSFIVDVIANKDMPVILKLLRRLEQLGRAHGMDVAWFDRQLLSEQIAPLTGSARRP